MPTEQFKICKELNDWKVVQVPRLALKLTCSYLDKFLWDVKVKKGVKTREIVSIVEALILLKVASVASWGDDFMSNRLGSCLTSTTLPKSKILPCLKQLEKGDLIEIVDESDPKKIHCRFSHVLFKDSLY